MLGVLLQSARKDSSDGDVSVVIIQKEFENYGQQLDGDHEVEQQDEVQQGTGGGAESRIRLMHSV